MPLTQNKPILHTEENTQIRYPYADKQLVIQQQFNVQSDWHFSTQYDIIGFHRTMLLV